MSEKPERLTVLPLADQAVMPWRNGGGSTREVARAPAEGADFAWRVSVARIEADGPFSLFPGIDRTLWLLAGAGMDLVIDGTTVSLRSRFASCAFPGEAVVHARLVGGPTEDLNVMVQRAGTRALTEIVSLATDELRVCTTEGAGSDLIVALTGELSAQSPAGTRVVLRAGDALRLDDASGLRRWILRGVSRGAALVLTFA